MKIGEIAKLSGFSRDTLRYYEKIGLIKLEKNQRGDNNYRIYNQSDCERLRLIKSMKNAGFTLNEIKDLMLLSEVDLVNCKHVGQIVDSKLEKIEEQLRTLKRIRMTLINFKEKCSGNCIDTLEQHQVSS